MKYIINQKLLRKTVLELGFRTLGDYCTRARIHRNTLRNLLAGKNVFSSSFAAIASSLGMDPWDLVIPAADFPSRIKWIDEIRPIVARLKSQAPGAAIVLFGSRSAKKFGKQASAYSDWDLGLYSYPTPLAGRVYLKLKGMVEEASENLVRKVDLVNLNQAPHWFLEGIANQIIFLEGDKEAFAYLRGLLDGIQKEKAA